ncbi:hypothetical protein HAX54_040571, partial [Datura stramonium]|nr:hypothetical protein [Datura stramonium]
LILASSHCLDPALHRRFVDPYWRFATLSLIDHLLPQFLFLTGGSAAVCRYPPVIHWCFANATSSLN